MFGFEVSALGEFTVCEQLIQGSTLGVQLMGRRAGGRLGREKIHFFSGVSQDWFDLLGNWRKLCGQTPWWLLTRCSARSCRADSPSMGVPGGIPSPPKLFLDELTALAAVL